MIYWFLSERYTDVNSVVVYINDAQCDNFNIMISLNDIWGENYFLKSGKVNPECKLFAWYSQEQINKFLWNKLNNCGTD